jgi:hypothetical protein
LRDRLEHLLCQEAALTVAGIEIGKDLSGFRVFQSAPNFQLEEKSNPDRKPKSFQATVGDEQG